MKALRPNTGMQLTARCARKIVAFLKLSVERASAAAEAQDVGPLCNRRRTAFQPRNLTKLSGNERISA
jgi:hypothetical protein